MSAHRLRPPVSPVHISLDGVPFTANEGESVAEALVAADCLTLARSAKLHRPRGPYCFRGACDGCLARIDGVPNVMACLVPVHEGLRMETQNSLGTRTVDLLRATDWFFPNGVDHHHLFAGIPGASQVMQVFARRVAGLGRLPDEAKPMLPGRVRTLDAVVIGGGPAGIAAAATLAKGGAQVAIYDDGVRLGGSLHARPQARAAFFDRFPLTNVDVNERSSAVGIYNGVTLVATAAGAELVRARAVVLAPGAHDGTALFEGNDLPGVFAARAACRLLGLGIAPGARVVVAGDGPYAQAFLRDAPSLVVEHVRSLSALVGAEGARGVRAVIVREGKDQRRIPADALLIDAPPAPSFELCEQAGVAVALTAGGYVASGAAGAPLAPGVWVTGEARGVEADAAALGDDGRATATGVLSSLAAKA